VSVLIQLLVSGTSVGMVYAVVAFGFQMTFATSRTINFGQGEALMLGALVGLAILPYSGYWLALPLVMLFGLCQGIVVERLAVAKAIAAKSEFGWVMATIALGVIFKNVAENIWGRDDRKFPSPLPELPISLGTVKVLPMEIAIAVGALAMMLVVELFNRHTIWGKAVVATANDSEAAGLMGIHTTRMVTLSYAVSSMVAAFGGVLVAPLTLTGARMGSTLALKAFAVAIIGGLSSGLGVIIGGPLLGISEKLTGYYLATGYSDVPGLIIVLVILSIRPDGLLGRRAIKKV